jgi:hypothetical protein
VITVFTTFIYHLGVFFFFFFRYTAIHPLDDHSYSCLGISTAFSLPDLIIILLFQVTSFKERLFLLKYKSTVSHSPIEWVYYASDIGKPDLCCYCAAEGIQQDNDLKKK